MLIMGWNIDTPVPLHADAPHNYVTLKSCKENETRSNHKLFPDRRGSMIAGTPGVEITVMSQTILGTNMCLKQNTSPYVFHGSVLSVYACLGIIFIDAEYHKDLNADRKARHPLRSLRQLLR